MNYRKLLVIKFSHKILATVQLNLNFTHACTHSICAKFQKLECAHTVARSVGMCTQASEHAQHMRDACHELALDLAHYTYSVATGLVTVGNELQLFCC